VIERAIGIMMSRSGGTEAEALDRLRSLSQHQHEKLPVIAETIVQEAVRRARARHINPLHQGPGLQPAQTAPRHDDVAADR
jgi:ANTAR domain